MAAHHCSFQSSRALCTAQYFAHGDSAVLLSAALARAALPAETSGARSLDMIPRAMQNCRQIQLLVPLTALSKGGKLPAAFLVQARVQSHSLGFQIAGAFRCWVRLPGNVPMLKIQWKITAVSGGKVFLLSFACGFYAVHIYCCVGNMHLFFYSGSYFFGLVPFCWWMFLLLSTFLWMCFTSSPFCLLQFITHSVTSHWEQLRV